MKWRGRDGCWVVGVSAYVVVVVVVVVVEVSRDKRLEKGTKEGKKEEELALLKIPAVGRK